MWLMSYGDGMGTGMGTGTLWPGTAWGYVDVLRRGWLGWIQNMRGWIDVLGWGVKSHPRAALHLRHGVGVHADTYITSGTTRHGDSGTTSLPHCLLLLLLLLYVIVRCQHGGIRYACCQVRFVESRPASAVVPWAAVQDCEPCPAANDVANNGPTYQRPVTMVMRVFQRIQDL